MLKAIETFYNGYRFRSRLEARWAVFFDSAGIEYVYEPEGFKLDKLLSVIKAGSSRLWTAAWTSCGSVSLSQNAKEKIGKL